MSNNSYQNKKSLVSTTRGQYFTCEPKIIVLIHGVRDVSALDYPKFDHILSSVKSEVISSCLSTSLAISTGDT